MRPFLMRSLITVPLFLIAGFIPQNAGKPMMQQVAFIKIPPGEFLMGADDGEDSEKPAHRVKISKGFEIGKYEVTQAQWESLMGNNSSHFKGADLPCVCPVTTARR